MEGTYRPERLFARNDRRAALLSDNRFADRRAVSNRAIRIGRVGLIAPPQGGKIDAHGNFQELLEVRQRVQGGHKDPENLHAQLC